MKIFLNTLTAGKDAGKWSWSLESNGGQVLAQGSQIYTSKNDCIKQITAIQTAFPATKIGKRQPPPSLSIAKK